MNTLEQFAHHARMASFHFADDTTKEWGAASRHRDAAIDLFLDDNNRGLRTEMRVLAARELWSLDVELRKRDERACMHAWVECSPAHPRAGELVECVSCGRRRWRR